MHDENRFGSDHLLLGELGRGAMGVVHEAQRISTGERSAIKILHQHLASDGKALGRFIQEREAFERIDHSNVVRVRDLLVDEGRVGIVMELIPAEDLKGLVDGDELSPAKAIEIALGIAAGLSAIHRADVVHRDLKPANVLIVNDDDGALTPKIVDFGVSRLVGQSVNTTTAAVGTPLYMAPEAAEVGPGAGAPADVYGLGVILFEMLTGSPPFTGQSAIALIRAHADDPPPLLEGVPPGLSGLVDRMLSKSPGDRPSAAEAEAELSLILPSIDESTVPAAVVAGRKAPTNQVALTTAVPASARTTSGGSGGADMVAREQSGQRSAGRLIAIAVAGFLAVIATVGGYVWQAGSGEAATAETGFAFNPFFVDDDLLVTRNWYAVDGRDTIGAELSLTNLGGAALTADYHEVFAPSLVADFGTVTFSPTPDELLRDHIAARYAITALGPGDVELVSYELAVDGDLSFDELERLAREQEAAMQLFYSEQGDAEIREIQLESLALTPAQTVLEPGDRIDLVLSGLMSDGLQAPDEFINAAIWASSDSGVVQLIDGRIIEAVAPGPATITTQLGDHLASAAIVVAEPDDGHTIAGPTIDGGGDGDDDEPVRIVATRWVAATRTGDTSVRVTFSTNVCTTARYAGSIVTYDSPSWPDANVQCWTDHQHNFTGLEPGSEHTWTITVRDRTGVSASLGSVTYTVPADDAGSEPDPVATRRVAATRTGDTSVRVTFSTNVCTTASYAGSIVSYDSPSWPDANDQCWTDHQHNFTGLVPGSVHRFTITVRNRSGASANLGSVSYTVPGGPEPGPVATVPVATTPTGDTSVRVTFRTNVCTTARYAGSIVTYNSPSWPDANDQCWTDHQHNFTGLDPGSTHTWTITAKNRSRVSAAIGSVTYTVPPIGDPGRIVATLTGDTSVRVSFRTSACTTARYAGSIVTYNSPSWPDANDQCWTDHQHNFTGLDPGSTHTWTITVRNRSEVSTMLGSVTYTVPDINSEQDPVLTNPIVATSTGDTSVRVTFSTNVCTTASYAGSIVTYNSPSWPDANDQCWTDHQHNFTGLDPGSTHTWTITVQNRSGVSASLGSVTYTVTGGGSEPDPVATSPVAVTPTGDTSVRVTFGTNVCTTASYAGSIVTYNSPSWPDANIQCWTDHQHNFAGLDPGSVHTWTITAKNRSGASASLGSVTYTVPG